MTRIIGGTAGGRRLLTPAGDRTRPTSDRTREALFSAVESVLGSWAGVRVLDLYAGSGAVALEALSRGAATAVAVEHDRRTAGLVRRNAATLDLPLRVEARTTSAYLAGPAERFDLVFLDPPYDLAEDAVRLDLSALAGGGWLEAGALVVVERSSRSALSRWPEGYEPLRERRYGETVLAYARFGSVAP